MSDTSVTKWELPDLFSNRPAPVSRVSNQTAPPKSDYEGGRQEGFEQGRKEGLLASEKDIQEKLQMFDSVMTNLSSPLAQVDNQIARELIQLSVRLAETIIHCEVNLQPELVERQVSEALSTLTTKGTDISVRLHPDDARILEESRQALNTTADVTTDSYRIIPDANLHRGGCVLQTPTTLVDATIEKQLKDLLDEMLDSATQAE